MVLVGGAFGFASWRRGPERSAEAFCAELPSVLALGSHLGALDVTGLRSDLEGLARLRAVAPADLEPDVATLSTIVHALTDAVSAGPAGESAADAERRASDVWRERRADLPALGAAARRVDAFARTSCGVTLTPEPLLTGTRPPAN